MSVNYNPGVVTSGLVMYLDAANPRSYPGSGNVWSDVSGNNNTGILTNGPTYNSSNMGSIVFDGIDDRVLIGDSSVLTSTQALSVNSWFNLTAFPGAIIGKGTSDTDEEYVVQVGINYVYFDVGNGGGPYTQPSTSFGTGAWYNVATVHSRTAGTSVMTVYINGVALSGTVVNPTTAPNDNAYPVSIGSRFYNSSNAPVTGKIGIVQLYNIALTQDQITQNFNALRGRYGI